MSTVKLKNDIHKLVDQIQSEQVLSAVYKLIKSHKNTDDKSVWKTLTDEQQEEILLAYEESEDEKNLLDTEDVFNIK